MKIGLWNIDHPETASGSQRNELRFEHIADYLRRSDCDAYIITEANAAIQLPGYICELSAESPFKSSKRYYGPPNSYHQVAIYSRNTFYRTEVAEPVNGLRGTITDCDCLTELYGNVITIKDQWSKSSSKTYTDRLDEQIHAIRSLPQSRTLIGGDFNLRLGWPQKQFAHQKVRDELAATGWVWPTEYRNDTVQHILHSPDLTVDFTIDFDVKYDADSKLGLSDHPFFKISVSLANKSKNA